MFRKYILPLLTLGGVGVGIFAAGHDTEKTPPVQPVSHAPQPPFQSFVAGAGIVQAISEDISIGTQIAGIVSTLHIQVGSRVKAGDALFTIDDRAQRAQVAIQEATVRVAEAESRQCQVRVNDCQRISRKTCNENRGSRHAPLHRTKGRSHTGSSSRKSPVHSDPSSTVSGILF